MRSIGVVASTAITGHSAAGLVRIFVARVFRSIVCVSLVSNWSSVLKPLERFPDDRRRSAMAAVILAIRDVVPEAFQARYELPARIVDWHGRVVRAMGNED